MANKNNTSHNAQNGAHAPQGEDSAAKRRAEETAAEAKGQAKNVAQDAKGAAQDLAQTAQHEAGEVKDAAVQQVKSLAGTVQEQVTDQVGTQHERLATQARSVTDDLHRVLSGQQPESDMVRQAVTAVADRAESLTQRLETSQPQDLLRDVRGFAARKPGTFLAVALGLGVVAGRLTRGMRDAEQPELTSGRDDRAPQHRREMEPMGVQGDVAPHHISSSIPAHTGDDAPRDSDLPRGTMPVPQVDPVTGMPVSATDPFDQTLPGGRA